MEDTPKEFQFYIRMPNFRLLGSIIKKKYPKVAAIPLKEIFNTVPVSWIQHSFQKVPFILDRNFANTVVLGYEIKYYERFQIFK